MIKFILLFIFVLGHGLSLLAAQVDTLVVESRAMNKSLLNSIFLKSKAMKKVVLFGIFTFILSINVAHTQDLWQFYANTNFEKYKGELV